MGLATVRVFAVAITKRVITGGEGTITIRAKSDCVVVVVALCVVIGRHASSGFVATIGRAWIAVITIECLTAGAGTFHTDVVAGACISVIASAVLRFIGAPRVWEARVGGAFVSVIARYGPLADAGP